MDSLQDKCLRLIMENLDQYSALYAKCQGTPFAKLFGFLRKVYSDKIFSKMIEFKEEHLDMLLSPYLKHLDIRHVSKDLIRSIAKRLKVQGNGIETIKARFSKLLYKELIPSSSLLVDIEIGEVRNTWASSIYSIYTSEMIKSLGKYCPLLRILKLRYDEVGYRTNKCHLYKGLKLCPKYYDAVSYLLDNCSSLEIVESINTIEILYEKHKLDLVSGDLEKCRKYSLTKLTFHNCENYSLLDAFRICFILCPKVTSVELHSVNSYHLFKCPDFEALQDVKIVSDRLRIGHINQFLTIRGRGLVSLELYCTYISVQTVIKCCPELQHLTIGSVLKFQHVKPREFSLSLPGLPKLKSFIYETGFSQHGASEAFQLIISATKNLENVRILYMRFTEEFCDSIFELGFNRVRELELGMADVPLAFLIKLLTQGNLQNLNVWDCIHVDSDVARDTLYRLKRDNQTVKVTSSLVSFEEGSDWWSQRDELELPDRRLYPGIDYDSDLDSHSNTDLDAYNVSDSDLGSDSEVHLASTNVENYLELLNS